MVATIDFNSSQTGTGKGFARSEKKRKREMFKPAEREAKKGITLDLKVSPGAKNDEFSGVHGDRLKVKVAAKPVEGAANAALLKFIASTFAVPPANVQILSGKSGRLKTLFIACTATGAAEQEKEQRQLVLMAKKLAAG